MKRNPNATLYPVVGINIRNEDEDIVVLIDTGKELVEVIRERGRFYIHSGSMNHTVTATGINDAVHAREEYAPPAKQTRIKYT